MRPNWIKSSAVLTSFIDSHASIITDYHTNFLVFWYVGVLVLCPIRDIISKAYNAMVFVNIKDCAATVL